MKIKLTVIVLITIALLLSISLGCKNQSSTPTEPADSSFHDGGVVVYEPNIYIYPKAKLRVSVQLDFPLGGNVIQSIPAYWDGWQVEVEPTGKIDNTYDYLFYESRTPDAYQYHSGWIVSRDSLSMFFRANLSEAGFSEREISDFLDYWIPRLIDYSYFIIYPQFSSDINRVIKLTIAPPPDNVLRLYYVVEGSTKSELAIPKPTVPKFERKGFAVTEWGVVIK